MCVRASIRLACFAGTCQILVIIIIIETICYNFIRIDKTNERMNERRLTVSGRSINDDVMLRLFPEFAPFCSSILEPNLAESSSVKFGRI